MKKFILFFTLSLGLTLSSCGDPCKDIMCGDNTICEEGVCNCLPNFEKDNQGNCVSLLGSYRDRFIGNWNVDETCSSNDDTFRSSIVKHPSIADQIIISNFSDNYTVYAIMHSIAEFEIPLQVIGNYSIVGSGIYKGVNFVDIEYSIEHLYYGTIETCWARYSK